MSKRSNPIFIASKSDNHRLNMHKKYVKDELKKIRNRKFKMKTGKKKSAARNSTKNVPSISKQNNQLANVHRWRLCPAGQHWVSEHLRKVGVSLLNPLGITDVVGHCALNPSRRDQLYPSEMQEIASRNFGLLLIQPNSDNLDFEQGSNFDSLIAGWTQYWNEVLNPGEILDPNTVKALIASESGFKTAVKIRAGKNDFARGLMQVTDKTRKFLSDEEGEIKDHFVNITEDEAYDPNLNICAGIRWLFRKKEIAEARSAKRITWDRVIYLYKAAHKNPKVMDKFREYSDRLRSKNEASK